MKRQTRIITLLVIDSVFFFIEIIVGITSTCVTLLMIRVHGAFVSFGSRFFSHGNDSRSILGWED